MEGNLSSEPIKPLNSQEEQIAIWLTLKSNFEKEDSMEMLTVGREDLALKEISFIVKKKNLTKY